MKVSEFEPAKRMVWSREEYSGPLLPMIWKSMPDLGPSFDQFARGLKSKSESR